MIVDYDTRIETEHSYNQLPLSTFDSLFLKPLYMIVTKFVTEKQPNGDEIAWESRD